MFSLRGLHSSAVAQIDRGIRELGDFPRGGGGILVVIANKLEDVW